MLPWEYWLGGGQGVGSNWQGASLTQKKRRLGVLSCMLLTPQVFSLAGLQRAVGFKELEASVCLLDKHALSTDHVPGTLWDLWIQRWAGWSGLYHYLVLRHCQDCGFLQTKVAKLKLPTCPWQELGWLETGTRHLAVLGLGSWTQLHTHSLQPWPRRKRPLGLFLMPAFRASLSLRRATGHPDLSSHAESLNIERSIHSFIQQYLSGASFVPGIVMDTWDIFINKTKISLEFPC